GTPDPDGYTVTVGGTGGASQHIATNGGRVTFDNLAAGDHTVTLSDLAANCSVTGGASKTVPVPAGISTSTSFPVDRPTPPRPTRRPLPGLRLARRQRPRAGSQLALHLVRLRPPAPAAAPRTPPGDRWRGGRRWC